MGKQLKRKSSGNNKREKVKIRGNQQLKGKKGSAANFITRNQAIKKLQLTLPEFRKLCIIKGVYPREPKKAPRGKDKTYYFKKDILYLQHDPLIAQFAERRVWKRKSEKAKHKRMTTELQNLRNNKPKYSLNHIVKERYPTFVDALRDLDDALSMIFLFALMPSTVKIAAQRVTNCRKLATEFQYYIIKSHSLRKVFISIKGIYYQAEIRGQTITWIVPFRFTPKVTKEVDYKVMLSFLEFHEVLLGFVNFKLFHSLGLNYPPKFSEEFLEKGDDLEAIQQDTEKIVNNALTAIGDEELLKKKTSETDMETKAKQAEESKARLSTLSEALNKIKEPIESSTEDSIDEDELSSDDEADTKKTTENDEEDEKLFEDDEVNKLRKELSVYENLFEKCHFWLSREVPRESLEFVIKSFGGKVSWEGNGNEEDESITHQIVDRDNMLSRTMTRELVQPQWIYDSINARVLIPTEQYKPGAKLPPHLSPFVDDYAVGYIPEYRSKLDTFIKEKQGISAISNPVPAELIESESDEEERFAQDLAAEKEGKYESSKKKLRKLAEQQQQDEAEQKETAESLLPRRKRRLLQRIKYSKKMKQHEIAKLEEKKQKLQEGKAKVVDKSLIVYEQDD